MSKETDNKVKTVEKKSVEKEDPLLAKLPADVKKMVTDLQAKNKSLEQKTNEQAGRLLVVQEDYNRIVDFTRKKLVILAQSLAGMNTQIADMQAKIESNTLDYIARRRELIMNKKASPADFGADLIS